MWQEILKAGDNFKREKESGLHGWFSRMIGKESGGKTQGGWIACGTCNDKGGPKPCGIKKTHQKELKEDADQLVLLVKHIKGGKEHELERYSQRKRRKTFLY